MLRDWFRQRLGHNSLGQARVHRPRRSRCLRAELDCLEGRALMSATRAINWSGGEGEVSKDGGSRTDVGGHAKQISAAIDAFDKPQVFTIGSATGGAGGGK
jgi:hypothetical protein